MQCPHCATPVDEHEANQCFNEWLATEVMGEEKPSIDHDHFHAKAIYSDGGNWYCLKEYDKGDVCKWHPINFSGYIGSAWKLVEKLKDDKFWFSLVYKSTIFPKDLDKAGWSAQFRCVHGGTRGDHFGNSVEHCLAICRAAIRPFYKESGDES